MVRLLEDQAVSSFESSRHNGMVWPLDRSCWVFFLCFQERWKSALKCDDLVDLFRGHVRICRIMIYTGKYV